MAESNTANPGTVNFAAQLLRPLFENRRPAAVPVPALPRSPMLQVLVFYYLQDSLTPEQSAELRNLYNQFLISEMRRRSAFQKVSTLLTEAGITFFPLKGCVMAYDYYPDPVLRHSVDVDILVAPEDAHAAFRLIAANGWTPKHEFHDYDSKHLPELINRKLCTVEVHSHLFEKDPEKDRRIMEILRQDPASPEVHLAHLMHHAFHHHNWGNAMKTVIDVGMILRRGKVDPEKYRRLAQEFGVENLLESVLAGFSDFYPPAWLEMFPAENRISGAARTALRALALQDEGLLEGYSTAQLDFLAGRSTRSLLGTALSRLRQLSPSVLGITYDTTPAKVRIFYPFLLCHYLFTRTFSAFSLLRQNDDPETRKRREIYRDLAELKESCKK